MVRSGTTIGTVWILIGFALQGCGQGTVASSTQEAWDYRNDPSRLGVLSRKYDEVPTEQHLSTSPWSDDYWATYKGGLSYRWQTMPSGYNYRDFLYDIPTAEQVTAFSEEEIALLSPAEKYDILLGRTDLPFVHQSREQTLSSVSDREDDVPHWFGLCHGWAPAAYMEPAAGASATRTAPDGRKVTFYSSDIRALMTQVYADFPLRSTIVGGRCNNREVEFDENGRVVASECRDTNPGTFHLVLADLVGQDRGFVVEVEPGYQVWNQPVEGYDFEYSNLREIGEDDPLAEYRADDAAFLVDVDLTLYYVVETRPSRSPATPAVRTAHYEYTLELDENQVIVGGEWLSDQRPDFLWTVARRPEGEYDLLDYAVVRDLLDTSLGEEGGEADPEESRHALAIASWTQDGPRGRRVRISGEITGDEGEQFVVRATGIYGDASSRVFYEELIDANDRFSLSFRLELIPANRPTQVKLEFEDETGAIVATETRDVQ